MADNDLNGLIEQTKSDSNQPSGSGGNSKLVSERSENSVLFSLSNLTAVGDKQAPRAGHAASATQNQGDKSGLIDLNTLARMGAGAAPADEEEGAVVPGAGAAAVPALFNVGTRRSNKGLIVGIAFLVLVVVGLGLFLTYLLVFKDEAKPPASAAAAEEETPPEDEDLGVEGAAAGNKAKASEGDEGEGDEAGAEGEGDEEGEGAEGEGDDPKAEGEGDEKDPKTVVAAVEDEREQVETSRGSRSSRSDRRSGRSRRSDDGGVDGALDKIRSGKKAKALGKGDVLKVLKAAALKAKKCGSGGKLVVAFDISSSGKTRNVRTAGGSLAGKPEEKCVLKVAKKMRFPDNDGSTKGVKFPFSL